MADEYVINTKTMLKMNKDKEIAIEISQYISAFYSHVTFV